MGPLVLERYANVHEEEAILGLRRLQTAGASPEDCAVHRYFGGRTVAHALRMHKICYWVYQVARRHGLASFCGISMRVRMRMREFDFAVCSTTRATRIQYILAAQSEKFKIADRNRQASLKTSTGSNTTLKALLRSNVNVTTWPRKLQLPAHYYSMHRIQTTCIRTRLCFCVLAVR